MLRAPAGMLLLGLHVHQSCMEKLLHKNKEIALLAATDL
jgi:hypothetical protein